MGFTIFLGIIYLTDLLFVMIGMGGLPWLLFPIFPSSRWGICSVLSIVMFCTGGMVFLGVGMWRMIKIMELLGVLVH
ncbi:MAG: hypothetical protein QXI94_02845 [Sulfolobales archaeon]